MLRGLYTAASGMLVNMISTEIGANNLANVSTVGFKKSAVNFQNFPELLLRQINDQGTKNIGSISTGSRMLTAFPQFTQGTLVQTGNPLDVGIQGDGFFTVKTLSGETAYTRNGVFTINQDGYLATLDGQLVQGSGGDIQIPPNSQITINEKGTVLANNQPIGSLDIAQFKDNKQLQKAGDNLFKLPQGVEVQPPDSPKPFTVHQGQIEHSNTNVVEELVSSITGMRLYEALQKNIQAHNETLGKAVNEVGRFK